MESEEKFFHPPGSSEIIRAVTRALNPDDEELTGRTARRYREGTGVKEDSEERILEALAGTLVQVGFIPSAQTLEEMGLPVHKLLLFSIRWHIQRWDDLIGGQRGFAMPVRTGELMALAYLRLIVIDLAFRVAAVCWLTGLDLCADEPPVWAQKGGRGLYLRRLIKLIGPQHLTTKGRNGLAEQVGVPPQTVDRWLYRGARPSNARIDTIANVLARYLDDRDAQTIAADLRRHYTLCSLADLLARYIGWAQVEELASSLVRFASRFLSGLRAFGDLPHQQIVKHQLTIAVEGITAPLPHTLVKWLWEQEQDPAWQGDLFTAVYKDWGRWLYDFATAVTVADEAIRFAQQEYGVTVDDPSRLPKMVVDRLRETSGRAPSSPPPWAIDPDDPSHKAISYHDLALDEAQADRFDEAIRLMRKAIDLEPESAWFHLKLAELLADTGEVQAAINECWIADGFASDWDQPRVMIGLILNNADRFEEAKTHLEATAKHLGRTTLNLALNLGIAYLGCGETEKALPELESVLQEKPDQGLALDLTARCYFLQGNHVEGWRKAKAARKLGYTATFDAATAKVFRNKNHS